MKEMDDMGFFRKFNAAFFQGDQEFISKHVTDDVSWSIVGTEPVKGKQGLLDAAFGIADYSKMEYEIESVICSNGEAAVKGISRRNDDEGNARNFCYCDMYTLDKDDPEKVKSIITFVIELEQQKPAINYWKNNIKLNSRQENENLACLPFLSFMVNLWSNRIGNSRVVGHPRQKGGGAYDGIRSINVCSNVRRPDAYDFV